jgi:high-affinity K+ transport system ATPase subunit B
MLRHHSCDVPGDSIPLLSALNIMRLQTPGPLLSAVIFNADHRRAAAGAARHRYRPIGAAALLRRNLIYGLGGSSRHRHQVVDMIITTLRLAWTSHEISSRRAEILTLVTTVC